MSTCALCQASANKRCSDCNVSKKKNMNPITNDNSLESYLETLMKRNEFKAMNEPITWVISIVIELVFLTIFSTWLDSYFESGHYFRKLALIPTIMHKCAWILAFVFQTGYFFDIIGEISLVITLLWSIFLITDNIQNISSRKILITACVIIWGIRLGAFSVIQMVNRGKDFRFKKIKKALFFYLFCHIAQSVWIFLVCLCLFIFNLKDVTIQNSAQLSVMDYIGLVVFIIGFLSANEQTWGFNDTNKKFINTGLWVKKTSYKNYNYFGECMLWFGICIMCTAQINSVYELSFVLVRISPNLHDLLMGKWEGI
eukprot:386026_1